MSSISRSFSQPLTRNYVNTQDTTNGEVGPYFFSQADLDTWYAANKTKIVKVGDVYLVSGTASGSTLTDVLFGNSGATELNHSLSNINSRKTMKDMGKEAIIGTSAQPRLLVLRKVQKYTDYTNANGATDPDYTGYVVVENNAEDIQSNNGRFMVRVARV